MTEMSPGAYSDACGVPSESGTVGCFREPEVAVVEHVEDIRAVEYGGVFTLLFAVVASDADIAVVGENLVERVELALESLLRAEHVEVVEADEVGDHGETARPSVAGGIVAFVKLAQVVGGHIEYCVIPGQCGQGGEREDHDR